MTQCYQLESSRYSLIKDWHTYTTGNKSTETLPMYLHSLHPSVTSRSLCERRADRLPVLWLTSLPAVFAPLPVAAGRSTQPRSA